MPLRIAIIVQTVAVFVQAVTAGIMLTTPARHALHSAGSYTAFVVVLIHLLVAILAWKPGGGPARPILHAAGFLALISAQVASGLTGLRLLHVPLGVLLFGLCVLHLTTLRNTRTA